MKPISNTEYRLSVAALAALCVFFWILVFLLPGCATRGASIDLSFSVFGGRHQGTEQGATAKMEAPSDVPLDMTIPQQFGPGGGNSPETPPLTPRKPPLDPFNPPDVLPKVKPDTVP